MNSSRRSYIMCMIIFIITLLSGLTYGQETVEKYYHYDQSIHDFRSAPFRTFKVHMDIPQVILDKSYVAQLSFLDTSYFDENYPAVLVKQGYNILDILEFANDTVYVITDRSDQIVKVFTKEEYNSFKSNFKSLGISLRYLDKKYDKFNEVFAEKGVSNSLNSEYRHFVELFESTSSDILTIHTDINNGSYNTINYYGYKTPIGNVIAGKYLVNYKYLKDDHSLFYQHMSYINPYNLKKSETKYKTYYYPALATKYYNYYGEDFIPDSDFIRKPGYYRFVSKDEYTFNSRFEFDKFLNEKGLQSKIKLDSFNGRVFKIYKELYMKDAKTVDSEKTYIKDVTYNNKVNSKLLIKSVEQSYCNYGIRTVFNDNGATINPSPFYNPNFYATEILSDYFVNTYAPNFIPKIVNVNGSIIYDSYNSNRRVLPRSEEALESMSEYELSLLGIYKNPRKSMKLVLENEYAFNDIHSGYYVTDNAVINLKSATNQLIDFGYIEENKKAIFQNMFEVKEENSFFVTSKVIDEENHKSSYTYDNGLLIDSYSWGFVMKNKDNLENTKIFYKIPRYMNYAQNPFTHTEQYTNQSNVSYWDLKDYYKGDISFVTISNGVETIENYKILGGNASQNVDYETVHHKARKLNDNTIVNIDLHFEEGRIIVTTSSANTLAYLD